jgi:hypothetical protein
MVVKDNQHDFNEIVEDKNVLSIVEQYANAGMEILIADFLEDFFDKKGASEPRLDKSASKELPKHLLYSIYSSKE